MEPTYFRIIGGSRHKILPLHTPYPPHPPLLEEERMNKEDLKTVDETLSRFDDETEQIELAAHETSLDFCRRFTAA